MKKENSNYLQKYNGNIPFTKRRLIELLETLCGSDGYVLEINNSQFSLNVKVELKQKKNVQAVEEMLEIVVPINMVFNVELRYNQHITVGKYTHGFLRNKKYVQVREDYMDI